MQGQRRQGEDATQRVSSRRLQTSRLLSRARATTGETRERYENEVVRLNLDVARDVARQYRNRGIADDDLDQVAALGLVKAVRSFDPTRGEDLLSYAVPTLRGEIRRHFRDCGWTVRPPRAVQEVQRRVLDAESELGQRLGRVPRPSEIAVHLDVRLDLVLDSLGAAGCFTPVSLDAPLDALDDAEGYALGDHDPGFAYAEDRSQVQSLLLELPPRDRRIVELRYFEHRTQAEIGAEVGVSQEQVSRLLKNILGRLREAAGAA